MNYLGHAFLSFEDPQILVGNLIGDYVKGSLILNDFPEKIRQGIIIHRAIDEYTDKHPANHLAKNLFRNDYQLYAGAFVDTVYDHYLANDPRHFTSESALKAFAQNVYITLEDHWDFIPQNAQLALKNMIEYDWLYNYRTVKGISKAFSGLVQKTTHLTDSSAAYSTTIAHYYELNQRYYEFIDDIEQHIKTLI